MGTFYAAYQGAHHWDSTEARAMTLHIKGGHPRPFSWEWFVGDPVAFFTFALSITTGALFFTTTWMARSAERSSSAALRSIYQNVDALIATERPYLTGGGGFFRVASSGPKIFRVGI